MTKEHKPRNPFEALGSENEDGGVPTEKPATDQQENLIKIPEEEDAQQMEGTEEEKGDDM